METTLSQGDPDDFDGGLDSESIQKLIHDLTENPKNAVIQLGKYGVTIKEGSEIHIGDVINNNLDQAFVEALASAVKNANDATKEMLFKHLSRQPLEPLKIDPKQIEKINSDLEIIDSLEEKGYLEPPQKDAFASLKQEVQHLNEFNQRIDRLHSVAKALLEESRVNLIKKIADLKTQGEKILESETLAKILIEQECKEAQLSVIEDFLQELEETSAVSLWIDKTSKRLSKRLGREALKAFPDIEKEADPEKVSYFCFSIYQFLEQISHCLKWGRYDILDSPDIPLVFDYHVYESAFMLIKETLNKDLPTRFSNTSKKLVNECIEYLISQLPFYGDE